MNRPVQLIALFAVCAPASAYEFRARFVERIGNVDLPIEYLDATNFQPHRIRIQFGVFDDASGPAPAGGFIGWNVGAISINGLPGAHTTSRSPGRIAPFNFAVQDHANGNPPLPSGDPFTSLTEIDATLGYQSPVWVCDASGNPMPQPGALVRGRNTYVSVYEITTRAFPVGFGTTYTINISGNLIAATEWQVIGTPIPPDCDTQPPTPGEVTYVPFPTQPTAFSSQLGVVIIPPTPGAGSILVAMAMLGSRRRR